MYPSKMNARESAANVLGLTKCTVIWTLVLMIKQPTNLSNKSHDTSSLIATNTQLPIIQAISTHNTIFFP